MEIRLSNVARKREFLPITLEIKFESSEEVNAFVYSIQKGLYSDKVLPPLEKFNIDIMNKIIDRLHDELRRQGF